MMKRFLDVVGAAAGLALLSLVLLAITILIRREMGAPVLCRQTRLRLHGKPFHMFKFRTMRDAVDS